MSSESVCLSLPAYLPTYILLGSFKSPNSRGGEDDDDDDDDGGNDDDDDGGRKRSSSSSRRSGGERTLKTPSSERYVCMYVCMYVKLC